MSRLQFAPRARQPMVGPLAVLIVLACQPALHAQPRSVKQDLEQAEDHFRHAELLKAETLFRKVLDALPSTQDAERRQGYDRLLPIYFRLARYDQAIAYGEKYRQWLAKMGDEPRRRDVLHQVATCYMVLGHHAAAEQRFKEVLQERPGLAAAPPLVRIEALDYLAQIAKKRERHAEAESCWRSAQEAARAVLVKPPKTFTWRDTVRCTWKLSECYRAKQPAEAIAWLEPLLAELKRRRDPVDLAYQCETLRLLAGHRAANKDLPGAENDLRQALSVYAGLADPDPVRLGDLAQELAAVLEQDHQPAEAGKYRLAAAERYLAVVRAQPAARPDHQPPDAAFWKLQQLYQQALQYKKALALADEPLGRRIGASLAGVRLQAEQGILNIYLGAYPEAYKYLPRVVQQLEGQSPPNLLDLPRTLNSLAVVEQALNNLDGAAKLAKKVQDLYKNHDLPHDLVLADTLDILGTCQALQGEYRDAIKAFRTGAILCARIGKPADRQHYNLLLNIAILHKSQGDLQAARAACEEAQKAGLAGPEDQFGYACFLCALASLDVGLSRFAEAGDKGQRLQQFCAEHDIHEGPLVVAAWHCQALDRLARKDLEPARTLWLKVRALQEKSGDAVRDENHRDSLLPRTLNYLGLIAEAQGQGAAAEALYREALQLQTADSRAYPITHVATLWRLAGLLDRHDKHTEARALLEKALQMVEALRSGAYGDGAKRATYFAEQFAPVYELLVESCSRHGESPDAFGFSARSRSRSLMEQLQVAGVDPRATVGPESKGFLDDEKALLKTISKLRVAAQLLPVGDADSPETEQLLADLAKAQDRYAEVWREIINASPVYRNLAPDAKLGELLATLRRHVVRPGTVLVTYHIGPEHSYLMLLSDRAPEPEVFTLAVPARLVAALQRPPAAAAGTDAAHAWPLDQKRLDLLVDHHLRQIDDPEFTTRGLRLIRESAASAPGELLEQIAEALLPATVRDRLKKLAPRQLIVVPDGALHKVPLESLVLKAGAAPRYGLDELPPIAYAPSVTVLAHVAQRPSRRPGPRSLLTVCNPAYPQPEAGTEKTIRTPSPARVGALLRGALPPLPFTAEESQRIRRLFDPALVKVLQGTEATKPALRANLKGRQVVHFAVHGLVSSQADNLFGGLVLTTPTDKSGAEHDDGFLSLLEIYLLPLQSRTPLETSEPCDLAVLSACVTNAGPQYPLEPGKSLASGFLIAGARHVLASQWSVEDQSTAELMSEFFAEAMADGKAIPYAVALKNARTKLRNTAKWSAPVYWAPFVLIGPGAATGSEWPALPEGEDVAEEPSPEASQFSPTWVPLVLGLCALGALAAFIVVTTKSRHPEARQAHRP